MAAKNTVNVQRMRQAITELENIHAAMQKHIKTLDETMSHVKQVWAGDAANTYLKQYQKNQKSFQNMANAIQSAVNALSETCGIYEQVDANAMDIVQKLGKRG
jgi:WXG100 family type VII secretion target